MRQNLSVDTAFIDKSNVFIEANSPRWRAPMKISLEDVLSEAEQRCKQNMSNIQSQNISDIIDKDTLIVDPSTLKVKVNESILYPSNVFSEPFAHQNIYHNLPPVNASSLSGMHMVTDQNYLYIWVGNRWKRIMMSEWY